MDLSEYDHKIFSEGIADFESVALEIFRFQYRNNPVYHEYVKALRLKLPDVTSIRQIPFLPIRFFKSHSVITTRFEPQIVFESSGTTGSVKSRHLVKDLSLYEKSFTKGFEIVYGPAKDLCIIGLLPSYSQRGNSSLVYMVNELVKQSLHQASGFYLKDYQTLFDTLATLEKEKQKTILLGVTFALLDFAEKYSLALKHTIIMETGGMKGRREEMIRQEVHDLLKASFNLPVIDSEYGMTELLSQAYSEGNGIFHCPPWMKVLIRDDEDPLSVQSAVGNQQSAVGNQQSAIGNQQSAVGSQQSAVGNRQSAVDSRERDESPIIIHNSLITAQGAINVIDLANIYSCSFIATDDAGKLYEDGSFEVLGRMDNSDLRGCSLLTL